MTNGQDVVRGMLRMEVAKLTDRDQRPPASGSGRIPEGSDWDWMDEEYPIGFRLMFVSGVTPERVIESFGANPGDARLLSAEVALEQLDSWLRVGRTGEWTFAFDYSGIGMREYEQRIARELSAGTELALLESNPKIDYFQYFADGAEVTAFEPLLAHERWGRDRDRFVSQMRQAGLSVDPPDDDDEPSRDPRIALLEMLTLALGIRLSRGVAMGPLLTVEPGPAPPERTGPGANGPSQVPGGSEWDWIDEDCPNAIRLMFVRGVTPERVIEAFGADPADAQLLTADAAHETAALLGRSSVRVGRAGDWAFAIDDWHEARGFRQIARELSAGTDLALFDEGLTSDSPDFSYLVDGAEMTGFDPWLAHERRGSDPDRFVPQMRQAGLIAAPRTDAELQDSPRVATLEMLTLALGIRLSRSVAMGPLLTAEPGSRG